MKTLFLLIAVISALILTSCTQKETECLQDSDCVPAQCCHPTSCIVAARAPDCRDTLCSMECAPNTMDCGQGKCVCTEGLCEVEFLTKE